MKPSKEIREAWKSSTPMNAPLETTETSAIMYTNDTKDDTSQPTLPSVLLDLVIRAIDTNDDKISLAKCMRVSKDVRDLVTPRLYRSITLNPKTEYLFNTALSETPPNDGENKTSGGHPNLKYTNKVIIPDHVEEDCPWTEEGWRGLKVDIDILRLLPQGHELGSVHGSDIPLGPRPTSLRDLFDDDNLYKEGIRECRCTEAFNPRKLVLETTSLPNPNTLYKTVLPRRVDTIVSKICMINSKAPILTRFPVHSKTTPKQRVYVIMPPLFRLDILRGNVNYTLSEVSVAAIRKDSGPEILVVNIDTVRIPPPLPYPATFTYPSPAEHSSGECKRHIGYYASDMRSNPQRERPGYKSPDELDKTSVRCITIDEYIAEYDTAGIFSEDELAQFRQLSRARASA
jgi:hypothetical protein